MDEFESIDDILSFAIEGEAEASEFYTELARKMKNKAMRDVFDGFAKEERGHKARLEGIRTSGKVASSFNDVSDLGLADYLVNVQPSANMTYQDALILAMKKEKAAFRLYTDLAGRAADADMKALFLSLAQEEARHKLRFEIEYDDGILKEN
jgi:rubrerythrin